MVWNCHKLLMLVIVWMGQNTQSHQTSYCCLRLHSQLGSFYFFPKTECRACLQKKHPKRNQIASYLNSSCTGSYHLWFFVGRRHKYQTKTMWCIFQYTCTSLVIVPSKYVQLNTLLPKPVSFYHAISIYIPIQVLFFHRFWIGNHYHIQQAQHISEQEPWGP